jgi:hypothetical protein
MIYININIIINIIIGGPTVTVPPCPSGRRHPTPHGPMYHPNNNNTNNNDKRARVIIRTAASCRREDHPRGRHPKWAEKQPHQQQRQHH